MKPQFYCGTVFLKSFPANYLKFIYNKYLEKGAEDSSLELASEAPTLESI